MCSYVYRGGSNDIGVLCCSHAEEAGIVVMYVAKVPGRGHRPRCHLAGANVVS
jgi:hypothetical protein